MSGRRTRAHEVARFALFTLVATAVLCILVEGLASFGLLGFDLVETPPLADRAHTRYDPDLGWANIPNLRLPNFYGRGRGVRIDARGFRGEDVEAAPPPGKVRVVCSGDSFTFGYGVGDDDTWCHRLEALEPRLETVNLGEPGYGVDQAYLRYRRDGASLHPGVHLLAFITDDFRRMTLSTSLGLGKPLLRVEHGALVVENVPVPRRPAWAHWLSLRSDAFSRLRTPMLIGALIGKVERWWARRHGEPSSPQAPSLAASAAASRDSTADLAVHMFRDLAAEDGLRETTLVLLHLPVQTDAADDASDAWRRILREELARSGIAYVDLIGRLRELPPERVRELFIPPGAGHYWYAEGHYTEEGNRVVAGWVLEELRRLPAVAARLASPTGSMSAAPAPKAAAASRAG